MTGYKADTRAFIRDTDDTLLKWADFKRVAYVVHDGERIGLNNSHLITLYPDETASVSKSSSSSGWLTDGNSVDPCSPDKRGANCKSMSLNMWRHTAGARFLSMGILIPTAIHHAYMSRYLVMRAMLDVA
ncbi:unnamed protein product [Parascedosporium putredinis]|uniref:Uncharacterized protein n=1 Tax=Parascedosporium putredinis TaxID=1442378 RepID=A0A9P1H083_9PEZI|nr:unnamed protein product [Parascedosporium putredinis]CAI7992530.1 unnamed protein product [Parascedosporium putredinis]